ncbi:cysteine synthase family protein [Candidatus Peregrinibacteria bacterium]|nr:cysteine synthase family protein [Candidatus Peregrinibacteria bacterium]
MNNSLDIIGNTPLVKLQKLSPNPMVEIFVKLEYFNPSGSIKDRIVSHIIEYAEKDGLLKSGGTIVENTSGNTGAAAAMIGAMKGYKVILTMPDKVSKEKQDALKAYGAEIVVTPTSASPDSPDHYVNMAKRIAKEIPNSFRINQYDNPKNPEAHYLTTGPEIWEQTKGKVTHFVAAGSTGGTVSGIGKFLKEQNSNIQIYMPDPIGSIYYEYFKTGKIPSNGSCSYQVEGIGEDHIAHAMNFSVVDEMYQFTDQNAFDTARKMAREEGIMGGGSSGANVWAALKLAESLTEPSTIVTVIPDNGIKYLSKFYNDEWMIKNNYKI